VQDVLRKLATDENGRNPPAKLLLNTKIVDVVSFGTIIWLLGEDPDLGVNSGSRSWHCDLG
jgi:hypothetical protein